MEVNKDWKNKNRDYLNAIQAFLDKASNIQGEDLRQEVIGSMLRCDNILTELAIEEINKNKNNN